MTSRTASLALATAISAAIALALPAASQTATPEKEKCFGIAESGKNDCAATGNNSCQGTSKVDYDKGAWKYVDKGTCTAVEVTLKDGMKRKGSLEPIKS